ncbi:MAG: hypothetical protein JRN20_17065 [Nitrososphaerota archaeon]|jgi:glycine cleavage system H lipoate-binding protein/TusA-related sulfurtransferase|nr:hypothetical protein [Nitrososphaerota archaeon]MDG6924295.1 hypothetical protein [Nitrososphaerota archaeon]
MTKHTISLKNQSTAISNGYLLRILNCDFPDNLYYDVENDVWLDKINESQGLMGVSTVLSFLAGKILKVKLKSDLKTVKAGQSLGTIESATYFGAIRSPISGEIAKLNLSLQEDPKALNESRFEAGWIAEYASFENDSLSRLHFGEHAKEKLEARIKELKVKCFKLLPDEQVYSIGTECSTTLASIDELYATRPIGTVLHLVTDDQTADVELVRWTMRTENQLVEARKEENLYHFIIRKSK